MQNKFPHQIRKAVIIVGPHTHWKDFFMGLAIRSVLKIRNAKFLGKAELFRGPFGFIFRWLGGTPVDRFSKQGVVEQVAEKLKNAGNLYIALSPEGTRKKVERLRTGFYHIALQASVSVIMVGLEYEKKQVLVSEPLFLSGNEAADFKKIISFFAPVRGRNPEKGMAHLLEE